MKKRRLLFSKIHMLRIMKIYAILLCVTLSKIFASEAFAQSISLSVNNEELKTVLSSIEEKSGYSFFYNSSIIDVKKRISISVENTELEEVMNLLFTKSPIDYSFVRNQIILFPKGKPELKQKFTDLLTSRYSELSSLAPQKINDQIVARMQQSITGVVTDSEGLPLAGVTIMVKGTTNGTSTDFNGKFAINTSASNPVLVFSYVGFATQEVAVNNQTEINISLVENTSELDEVVVVGYGTKKKINLTDAVADVNMDKEIGERPVASVNQMLQGAIANFNVSTNSSGGEPGSTTNLNIRGAGTLTGNGGTPYILLDGVPITVGQMNSINPYDVESVSVLKDAASASIYGSRGAYGVILITTKRGKAGRISVEYSGNIAFASPTSLPESSNSLDFARAYNDAATNGGATPLFDDEEIQRIQDYLAGNITDETQPNVSGTNWMYYTDGYANNDWYDIMYKDYAPRQQHKLGVNGGTEKTTFYLSGNYYNQLGNLEYADDEYDRYNFTLNLNTEATDWLRFDISSKYTREHTLLPSGGFGNYDKNIIYHQISRMWPVNPLYAPDGTIVNSDVKRIQDSGNTNNYTNNTILQGAVELEPITDWVTRMSYNYHLTNANSERIELRNYIPLPDGTSNNVGYNPDEIIRSFSENTNKLFNITTNYKKSIGNHNIDLLLGYEQREVKYTGLTGRKSELVTENVPTISTAVGDDIADDALSQYSTRGFFYSLSYNYKDKFLLSGKTRIDESSFFREGKRRGVFPSVSAGYVISQEDFWSSIKNTVNTLKFRGSWGQLGNHDPALANRFQEFLNVGNGSYLLNGARPNVVYLGSLVSPNLTWETVTSIDFGLDAALFNNKLNMTFDWFSRTTSDMIGPVEALPSLLGASAPQENNAELRTEGWELSLKWRDQIGQVSYRIGVNIGDNKTKVVSFNNPTNIFSTYREGQMLGEIWGHETVGYFQSDEDVANAADQSYYFSTWGPGDIQYADLNGDGVINIGDNTTDNPGDRKIIGNSTPRYNYGINAGLTWKGFDLSVLFQGVGKRDYMFGTGANLFWGFRGNQWQNSITKTSLDYWTPENTDAYYPKPYMGGQHVKNTRSQTKYLQDASYIRLKNVQLSYSLPTSLINEIGLTRAQVYFSGENLFTITDLHENFDPEALGGAWGNGKIYPLQRVLSFGVNLGL
ncbi:TonB-dependent receptor [Zhouia amylolytica]|nr:TonB-dependent receptor [Zhouia amylolytica]